MCLLFGGVSIRGKGLSIYDIYIYDMCVCIYIHKSYPLVTTQYPILNLHLEMAMAMICRLNPPPIKQYKTVINPMSYNPPFDSMMLLA